MGMKVFGKAALAKTKQYFGISTKPGSLASGKKLLRKLQRRQAAANVIQFSTFPVAAFGIAAGSPVVAASSLPLLKAGRKLNSVVLASAIGRPRLAERLARKADFPGIRTMLLTFKVLGVLPPAERTELKKAFQKYFTLTSLVFKRQKVLADFYETAFRTFLANSFKGNPEAKRAMQVVAAEMLSSGMDKAEVYSGLILNQGIAQTFRQAFANGGAFTYMLDFPANFSIKGISVKRDEGGALSITRYDR